MAKQTVREQLVAALEWDMLDGHTSYCPAGWQDDRTCSARCVATCAAIERAKREPTEEDCCHLLDDCIEYVRDAGRP